MMTNGCDGGYIIMSEKHTIMNFIQPSIRLLILKSNKNRTKKFDAKRRSEL
jgi:hypothetical protein